MKLAEALLLRGDMQKKLASLRERIGQNAVVQEGEQPHEDPNGRGYATALTGSTASFIQGVLNGSIAASASTTSSPPPTGTVTSVFSSDLQPTVGEVVTFTATVLASDGSQPGGRVDFFDNGNFIGTGDLVGGRSLFGAVLPSAGVHQITARYDGNPASSSAPLTVTVFILAL